MDHIYERIFADAEFQALQRRRSRLVWILSAVMLVTYFGFILVIAFRPELFAARLGPDTVVTWGVPVGVAIILLGLALTGVYVWRANGEFDRGFARVVARITRESSP